MLTSTGIERHNYLSIHSSGGAFNVFLFRRAVKFVTLSHIVEKTIDRELRPFCTGVKVSIWSHLFRERRSECKCCFYSNNVSNAETINTL